MTNAVKPNCGGLTWKAKHQQGLARIQECSELWNFARSWIRKFRAARTDNASEKFIYLWVTINAWASMSVPDKTRNHEDAYLVHSIAADQAFDDRFAQLLERDEFRQNVEKLLSLAPVFQVLWMRNNHVESWGFERESRLEFVHRVIEINPYNTSNKGEKFPAFSPSCALEHIAAGESIPKTWPHVIHIIYQIRCNLFHGGKNYSEERDRIFIELAYSIAWEMWEPELPERLRNSGTTVQRQ